MKELMEACLPTSKFRLKLYIDYLGESQLSKILQMRVDFTGNSGDKSCHL
jgi:hypothetical protein